MIDAKKFHIKNPDGYDGDPLKKPQAIHFRKMLKALKDHDESFGLNKVAALMDVDRLSVRRWRDGGRAVSYSVQFMIEQIVVENT